MVGNGSSGERAQRPTQDGTCGTANRLRRVNLSSSVRLARNLVRLGFDSDAETPFDVSSAPKACAVACWASAFGCAPTTSRTMPCQPSGATAMRASSALAAGGSTNSGCSAPASRDSATRRSILRMSVAMPGPLCLPSAEPACRASLKVVSSAARPMVMS
eukprot:scaffold92751_cov28-Tisochrysis_lutea.AAC.5